jgi:uncharacterized protein (DUF342 family)
MRKAITILALILGAGTLLAQKDGPAMGSSGAPRLDALKSFLQLSDKQVQDLTALLTSLRDSVKPVHEQIAAKKMELKQEMDKTSPDSGAVAQLMVDIKNLQSQIKTKRDELRPQLIALLSDSQKTALTTLQQALSLQQAALEAAASDLIEAPPHDGSAVSGLADEWRGRHH